MHSKDKLAAALRDAGLEAMAAKAAEGYYHDFLSPLATPCLQLAEDLMLVGSDAALAIRLRHLDGEFDATKEESDEWAKSADGKAAFDQLSPSVRAVLGAPHQPEPRRPKARRALKPDAQAFDRVEIVTVPRFKQSEMSGDEWRISAAIIFYRKGREVHRTSYRNVQTACQFAAGDYLRACDDGKAYFAGEADICDQEGCSEKATWKHTLKKRYSREGHASDAEDGDHRLFCEQHKERGDCGLDDADENYIVEPYPVPE